MIEKRIISNKEFNERIHWSLDMKIDHSLYIIENFLAQFSNSSIAFSGGLDSTVLLHLVRIVDKERKGVFVNTTNEYTSILKFVKQNENIDTILPKITFIESMQQFGFPLVSKRVAEMIETFQHPTDRNVHERKLYLNGISKKGYKTHYILPDKWKYLINAPFHISAKCCKELKIKPMKENTEGWLIGTKATDSLRRRQQYVNRGCISLKDKQATPLSIWTDKDIWTFIKKQNIPYADIYDQGETSTGCAYCGFGCQFDQQRFYRNQKREPKRFEKIMNVENNGIKFKDALRIVQTGSLNPPKLIFV